MRQLNEMKTVAEVDAFIKEICQHDPDLERKASSRRWSQKELDKDPKLAEACKAFNRRSEIIRTRALLF